jgi:hypothetical protein
MHNDFKYLMTQSNQLIKYYDIPTILETFPEMEKSNIKKINPKHNVLIYKDRLQGNYYLYFFLC